MSNEHPIFFPEARQEPVIRFAVYFVDDDDGLRASMAAALRLRGYDVLTFANARDFLQSFNRTRPAVVIIDVKMPGISGLDLHQALIERSACVGIVYLSGAARTTDVIHGMKQGAMDFLEKPVSMNVLVDVIENAGQRALEDWRVFSARQRFSDFLAALTERERQILNLILQGCPNREISQKFDIKSDTVKKHRATILEKFGVSATHELISAAIASGFYAVAIEA